MSSNFRALLPLTLQSQPSHAGWGLNLFLSVKLKPHLSSQCLSFLFILICSLHKVVNSLTAANFEFWVIQNTGVLKVSGNFQVAQLTGRENYFFFPTESTENQKKVKRGTSKYIIFPSTEQDSTNEESIAKQLIYWILLFLNYPCLCTTHSYNSHEIWDMGDNISFSSYKKTNIKELGFRKSNFLPLINCLITSWSYRLGSERNQTFFPTFSYASIEF